MNKSFFKNRLFFLLLIFTVLVSRCERGSEERAGSATAAGRSGQDTAHEEKTGPRLVCSFFPIWVFTRNVVAGREGVQVDLLIPAGQGPHHYALSPADMKKLDAADLFIINGLGLEDFIVEKARKAIPELKVLEAARSVPPIYEGDRHHDAHSLNPHAFASPRDAALMVEEIGAALAELDPEAASLYRKNAETYAARLRKIADEMKAVVQKANNRKVVTFHNAFSYLARDLGLEIIGVVESAAGEAPSAGELARLARMMKEERAVAVFGEPQFPESAAEVLAREAGVRVFILDPAETGELRAEAYEEIMKKNLETLKQALLMAGEASE